MSELKTIPLATAIAERHVRRSSPITLGTGWRAARGCGPDRPLVAEARGYIKNEESGS